MTDNIRSCWTNTFCLSFSYWATGVRCKIWVRYRLCGWVCTWKRRMMWGCFSNFMICTSLKIFFRFSSSSWVLSTIFIATWRQRDKKGMEGEMRVNDERERERVGEVVKKEEKVREGGGRKTERTGRSKGWGEGEWGERRKKKTC